MSSVGTRTVNKRGEGALLRAEIIDAAIRLLTQAATRDAVTLRSIAREAGIAAPSIYQHFADRDAVIDAVMSSTFEQLEASCAAANETGGRGVVRIRAIARAYVVFAAEHRAGYRALFERRTSEIRPEPPAFPVGIRAFQYLVDSFEQLAAEYVQDLPRDPVGDAQALWCVLHGVVTLMPATPGFPWVGADVIVDRLVDAIVARQD